MCLEYIARSCRIWSLNSSISRPRLDSTSMNVMRLTLFLSPYKDRLFVVVSDQFVLKSDERLFPFAIFQGRVDSKQP
jgi:hypothetical protein